MIRVEFPKGKQLTILMDLAEEGHVPHSTEGGVVCFFHLTETQQLTLKRLGCSLISDEPLMKPPE